MAKNWKIGLRGEIYWPLALRHKKVYLMFEAAPAFVLMPEVQWKAAVGVTSGICCPLAPLICPSADTAALLSTHTHRQTLSSELGGKGFPVCLPLPFTQSFIKQGTTVSAKHNNWKKPEKEGGAFSRGNRNTVGVEKNRHWKINNFLLASNLKARPDGFHAPFLSSSFSSFNFE